MGKAIQKHSPVFRQAPLLPHTTSAAVGSPVPSAVQINAIRVLSLAFLNDSSSAVT